jgi:hypothetical protein
MPKSQDNNTIEWKFVNAWQTTNTDLVDQVKTMWKNHLEFPGEVILERCRELVVVVLRNGEVAGVSTATVKPFKLLNNNLFFFYRFFIRPDCRVAGLDAKLTLESARYLEEVAGTVPGEKPIGIISILENEQIAKTIAARRAVWRVVPFTFIGMVSPGHPVRVYYFNNALI